MLGDNTVTHQLTKKGACR